MLWSEGHNFLELALRKRYALVNTADMVWKQGLLVGVFISANTLSNAHPQGKREATRPTGRGDPSKLQLDLEGAIHCSIILMLNGEMPLPLAWATLAFP